VLEELFKSRCLEHFCFEGLGLEGDLKSVFSFCFLLC
jgi:hypothetical protein